MNAPRDQHADAVEDALSTAFADVPDLPYDLPDPPPRFGLLRGTIAAVVLAGVTLATGLLAGGALLASREPGWWDPADPNDARVAKLARDVERAVVNLLQRHGRDDGPWAVEIGTREANAWLAARLPRWAESQGMGWPESCERVAVRFTPDAVRLAAQMSEQDGSRIVSASFRPEMGAMGSIRARGTRVGVGRLSMPARLALRQVAPWVPDELSTSAALPVFAEALVGARPLIASPTISLDGGRRVRVIHVDVREGALVLTCITERTGADDPPELPSAAARADTLPR